VLNSVLKVIELHSEILKPVSFRVPVCSDPDDDKFLEAAIAAGADYVVSGDKALLNVKFHREVEVLRPLEVALPIGAEIAEVISSPNRLEWKTRTLSLITRAA